MGTLVFEGCLWKRLATASGQAFDRPRVPCAGGPATRALPHRDMTVTPAPDKRSASQATAVDARLIRAVGMWGLAANIVNVTIGGGIFRLPGGVYQALGSASPLAYIVCAIVIALIVVCFAEAGSRVSLTGGLYAYV